MSNGEKVKCQVRRSPECQDGLLTSTVFGPDGEMAEDGTWDGETVVCDSCYLDMGQPGIAIDHPDARSYGRSIGQGDPRDE